MTAAFSSRRWVATAMLAALTLPALAQTQAPAPAAAQAASAPARKAGDMAQRYQERMAQRQAALKEKLKLTAALASAPPAPTSRNWTSSPPPSALTACASCAPGTPPRPTSAMKP